MKSIFSILIMLGLGLSATAFGSPLSNLKQSCKNDIQKFCGDITPGQGRTVACLKAHDDKLSSQCSKGWTQARNQMMTKMKQMRTACSGDVQKFCGNAMGAHEIGSCLSDHVSDLSASCKNFREQNNMAG